jgi:phosphatidylserine/phosphatidylglycerophosphate/cardiolipin synthase-like enzyme
MKDLRKIAVWTAPVAILIVLVLVLTGCSNPDEKGPFGFNIASNSNVKAVFTDPIFRQIGFDSNDPYSKYLTEGVGLEYYDQRYIIDLMENTVSTMDIASTMVNNADIASILVGLATRGVQIRVVTEKSNFDFINPTLPATTRQVQQQLIDAGVQVRTDNDDANRLMHERYMIIDNTYLLIGSADFLCTSFSETINNVMVIESIMSIDDITTAKAADVNTVMVSFVFDFEQMFNRNKYGVVKETLYKNTFEDTGTKIEVYFGPTNNMLEQIVDELNNVDDIMFYAIQQFTNRTMIANMEIMKSIFTVMGVVDSSSDLPADDFGRVSAIEFDGQGYNTLNHKYIVIDFPLDLWDYEYPSPGNLNDPVVVTGSPNWNESNFTRNDECLIVVHVYGD